MPMVVVEPTPILPPLMRNVSATQVSLATLGSELLLRRTNRRGGGGVSDGTEHTGLLTFPCAAGPSLGQLFTAMGTSFEV